ncbi:hypothetical protein PM082_013753 [Marasmius tenuissimus]|nr:hypothetical protein PM082_013753 [Marasmius tenuissimus]
MLYFQDHSPNPAQGRRDTPQGSLKVSVRGTGGPREVESVIVVVEVRIETGTQFTVSTTTLYDSPYSVTATSPALCPPADAAVDFSNDHEVLRPGISPSNSKTGRAYLSQDTLIAMNPAIDSPSGLF